MTRVFLRAMAFVAGLAALASVCLCVVLPIWVTVGLTPRAILTTLASVWIWVCLRRLISTGGK